MNENTKETQNALSENKPLNFYELKRSDEIVILFKTLLGQTEDAIGKSQFSYDRDKIIRSVESVIEVSKVLESYLNEYNKLK